MRGGACVELNNSCSNSEENIKAFFYFSFCLVSVWKKINSTKQIWIYSQIIINAALNLAIFYSECSYWTVMCQETSELVTTVRWSPWDEYEELEGEEAEGAAVV